MAHPAHATPSIETSLAHFRTIPWIANPHLSDPTFHVVTTNASRTLVQPGNGHTLTGETWNTEKTITHLITTYRPGPPSPSGLPPPTTTTEEADADAGQAELRRFYTFGTGLNAHPNLLHGGVIATILDSAMGNAIWQAIQPRPKGPTFTVNLNITYKKPVSTPGSVMVRATVVRVEGRKIWVSGRVEGEGGVVHASAEGMWLSAKSKI
ncbi:hypothetical protein LTR84_008243 [Exophiala bonariae]|uniref:Thioesterase domain-containing protein n=1 Tax=Exophiala bonariae TaxID=1690606 RepID=A0AAV9N0C8_9EURO|nr:hypothetical protein LTR84_008243 [Exophiala bonariae]